MPRCTVNRNGFTLIELLVVIAVIGLLASVVLVATNNARAKAKDAKRIGDLAALQTAAELYYTNHGEYPRTTYADRLTYPLSPDELKTDWNDFLTALRNDKLISDNSGTTDLKTSIHIAQAAGSLYQDPEYNPDDTVLPTQRYDYMPSSDHQNFRIRARLEFQNNPVLLGKPNQYFFWDDETEGNDACDPRPAYRFFCVGPPNNFTPFDPGKPVIYLYPTKTQEISVSVKPKAITDSVPLYKEGWRVVANPNGDIFNPADGQHYPYLFWEGKSNEPKVDRTKGFVAKTDEIENFLTEKLELLGLNAKETADFIEYWAPRMKTGPYVYVYFMPQADFDKLIPIEINPKPDTIIRVYMLFKPLGQPIQVEEQELTAPPRIGFTVIEWGGDRSPIK